MRSPNCLNTSISIKGRFSKIRQETTGKKLCLKERVFIMELWEGDVIYGNHNMSDHLKAAFDDGEIVNRNVGQLMHTRVSVVNVKRNSIIHFLDLHEKGATFH